MDLPPKEKQQMVCPSLPLFVLITYACIYVHINIYIICVCVCFRFSIWTRRIKLSPCFGRRWEAARRAEWGAVQSWRPVGPTMTGDGEKKHTHKNGDFKHKWRFTGILCLIFWWCGRPWLPACQVWRWLKTRSHEISWDGAPMAALPWNWVFNWVLMGFEWFYLMKWNELPTEIM